MPPKRVSKTLKRKAISKRKTLKRTTKRKALSKRKTMRKTLKRTAISKRKTTKRASTRYRQRGGNDSRRPSVFFDAVSDPIGKCDDLTAMIQQIKCTQTEKSEIIDRLDQLSNSIMALQGSMAPKESGYKSKTARYIAGQNKCVVWDSNMVQEKVIEAVDDAMSKVEDAARGQLSSKIMEQVHNAALMYIVPQVVNGVRNAILGS